MDNIVVCMGAIISTNGSWLGIRWLSGSHQLTNQDNTVVSLPCHGHHGTTSNIIHKILIKGFSKMFCIVTGSCLVRNSDHLHSHQLQSFPLKTRDNLSYNPAINNTRL